MRTLPKRNQVRKVSKVDGLPKKSTNQDVREAYILGWGPRHRRGADSLRSLDKLGR